MYWPNIRLFHKHPCIYLQKTSLKLVLLQCFPGFTLFPLHPWMKASIFWKWWIHCALHRTAELYKTAHCTKSSMTCTCWVCSAWANHLPRAQIQTSPFQTYPTLGRSTEALHAVHSFSLFYGKGNDVQIVTLSSEKESLLSALLLVARFKIQKIPTKQARNENQQLSLQQAFKYNMCVTNKQNKLNIIFLYQQLYSCMGT